MLEDIAILTGGTVISEERGFKLENVTIDMLGTAEKIVIDKDNTTIINGTTRNKTIIRTIYCIKHSKQNEMVTERDIVMIVRIVFPCSEVTLLDTLCLIVSYCHVQ